MLRKEIAKLGISWYHYNSDMTSKLPPLASPPGANVLLDYEPKNCTANEASRSISETFNAPMDFIPKCYPPTARQVFGGMFFPCRRRWMLVVHGRLLGRSEETGKVYSIGVQQHLTMVERGEEEFLLSGYRAAVSTGGL